MTMSPSPNGSEIYDLVIVGCGPVGLLAAHAAFQRGCQRILLLEQAREFSQVCQGLVLQPNAVRVLKMIIPRLYAKLKSPYPIPKSDSTPIHTYDGSVNYSLPRADGDDDSLVTKWWLLQRALLDDLDANIEIRNDASVIELAHFPDHVQIKYVTNRPRHKKFTDDKWGQIAEEDATAPPEEHFVNASVLIGADGIWSRCRQEIYRAMGGDDMVSFAQPVNTGMMKVDVFLDEIPKGAEDAHKKLSEMFPALVVNLVTSDASARLANVILNRLLENQESLTFMAYIPPSLASRPEDFLNELAAIVDSEVAVEPLRILTKYFAKGVDAGSIRAEALPLKMVPLFSFEGFDIEGPTALVRPYAHKRVFMVGDALHGCPPLMAMGAAMGFEDVCELVDLLADAFKWKDGSAVDVSDDELREIEALYRNARSDRLKEVVTESTFPSLRTDGSVYLPWRKNILDFKPVATGWTKLNKSVGVSSA